VAPRPAHSWRWLLANFLKREVSSRYTGSVGGILWALANPLVQLALYGPSAFARALMNGAKIDAFAMQVNKDGTKGYYSVLYVKADSPYQKIEDLKGKNLGLVDPNSTSGNNVPRFEMNALGIKPEEYFSNIVYTGSHENAVIALQQGQVDGAFNWWNDENESMLRRMERKNMAKYDDFRIIFKSDQIVNSPYAMLTTLPAELQASIKDAFFNIQKNDPEAFQVMTDGEQQLWVPAGFAHGFLTLSEHAEVLYKTTDFWSRDCERAIRWDDPALAIAWPLGTLADAEPQLSEKDAAAPLLAELTELTEGDLF
jgi:phosphonate transport system substrate-binding protein